MIENEVGNLGTETKVAKITKESADNWYIEKYPPFSSYVETKIFEEKNANSAIRITPRNINFTFDALTSEVTVGIKEFNVLNISSHPVRILILPPQTEFFSFSYIPVNWLAAGMHVLISVTFRPTLPRPYKDWLRVCNNSDSNLMVPIVSKPVHKNLSNIPTKINFGFVPIGKMAVYKMILQPVKNIVLKFLFVINSHITDCKIEPSQGRVEDTPVEINISYCPTSYTTVLIPVQLYLPPIMMTPHFFTIEAFTKPVNKSEKLSTVTQDVERKPKEMKHKKNLTVTNTKQIVKFHESKKETISVLKTLTQHDINILLMKKEIPDRDPQEQLGPNGIFMDKNQELKNYAHSHFQQVVKQLREEDKKARLTDNKERIFEINCPPHYQLEIRNENLALFEEYQDEKIKSDIKENDLWHFRYQRLWMFIQAARSVLVRMRMLKRLEILKNLTPGMIQELEEVDRT